jgi:hypothetical protein
MKFVVALILTALLAFAECLFFPWWSIAIAAFIVAIFIHQKPLKAFLAGFLGLFILWAAQAAFIDVKNGSLLSRKIAALLPLGGSSILLILVTAFVGGLVAGFGALTGSYARKVNSRD